LGQCCAKAKTVAAGVVKDAGVVALAALFDVAAQLRRAAGLNGTQRAELFKRQAMSLAVSRPVAANDVGQFQCWPCHGLVVRNWRLGLRILPWPPSLSFGKILRKLIEGRTCGGNLVHSDGGVASGGFDAAMAEQHLNDANVFSVFQQVSGKAVARPGLCRVLTSEPRFMGI